MAGRAGFQAPTSEQGTQATERGKTDALAGVSRDAGPWSVTSASSVERTLYRCYQLGYAIGLQAKLQKAYGNSPTA